MHIFSTFFRIAAVDTTTSDRQEKYLGVQILTTWSKSTFKMPRDRLAALKAVSTKLPFLHHLTFELSSRVYGKNTCVFLFTQYTHTCFSLDKTANLFRTTKLLDQSRVQQIAMANVCFSCCSVLLISCWHKLLMMCSTEQQLKYTLAIAVC